MSDYLPENTSNDIASKNDLSTSVISENSDDETDQGVWDFSASAANAFENMQIDVREIGLLLNVLTAKIDERTEEVNLAAASGASRNDYIIYKNMQIFAQDLMSFTTGLTSILPTLRKAWDDIRKGLSQLFAKTTITNEEDKDAIINFRSQMNELDTTLSFTLSKVTYLRDTLHQFNDVSKGISKELNNASRKTKQTMNELIDILSIGEAYLLRIINLSDEKLAEYDASQGISESTSK